MYRHGNNLKDPLIKCNSVLQTEDFAAFVICFETLSRAIRFSLSPAYAYAIDISKER